MDTFLKACCYFFLSLTLSGCFQNADTNLRETAGPSTGLESEITPTDFSGAEAAANTVSGIEVRWKPSLKPVTAYKIYRVSGKKLSLLTSVAGEITSYIDGSVSWGSIFSYVVRAVDSQGVEDSNIKQVSSISWAGISSVEAESRTSLRVKFETATPIADEIRIYIQPAIGQGDKTLATTITGSDLEAVIENLRPGFKYKITAQAYLSSLKKEDGNNVIFAVTTLTEGYHTDGSSAPKWNNVINVRAFGESPNSPAHPNITGKSPQTNIVELAFISFTSMPTDTTYVVVRAKEGQPLDTATPNNCTETTESSCKVNCVVSGSGILTCKDETVAPSPMRYRYTMAIVHKEGDLAWAEPVPQESLENFSVLVPIPPKDMVLMQRDAANYEMCQNTMNKTPDPTNHNRCAYNGVGAIPFSTGPNKAPLGLSTGYYDFGYNLFIDRYPLACNWTRVTEGGKCGPNQTAGDCVKFSTTVGYNPNTAAGNPFGDDGQVMYVMESGGIYSSRSRCFIKDNGTWRNFADVPVYVNDTAAAYKKMMTSDPGAQGGKRPPLFAINSTPESSQKACNSQTDMNYGAKRIPRLREYRAYNTFSTIPGEPYYLPYSTALTIMNGGNHNEADRFRCGGTINEPLPNGVDFNAMLTAWLDPANEIISPLKNGETNFYGVKDYFIGSKANIDCQSRYGAQVMNGWTPLSDYFTYNTTTKRLLGGLSPIDNGNRDLLSDVNGGTNGFVIDMNKISPDAGGSYVTTLSTIDVTNNKNFTAAPLGLPIYLSNSVEYLSNTIFTLQRYYDTMNLAHASESSTNPLARAALAHGRWGLYTRKSWTERGDYISSSVRCVLPAE